MAIINATELAAMLEKCGATKVVLALSGGLDSMVLLELLHQVRQIRAYQLQAIYVNHGLSADAPRWAEHCANACAERNIDFVSLKINIDAAANVEAAARDGRYQALAPYIDSAHTVLLTGHHADDQLETLLLALKRGAGVSGLSGMARQRPFARGSLLRPLLHCERRHILAFAQQNQLQWVEDSSNRDNRFDRNYIRNEVAPLLINRWPAFTDTTLRSMQHLADHQQLLNHYTEQALLNCANGKQLNLTALEQYLPLQQDLVIRSWLAQFKLNPSSQWLLTLKQQVIEAREDAVPELVLAGYQLRRFQKRLYLLHAATELQGESEAAISCQLSWPMQSKLQLPAGLGELAVCHEQAAERLAMTRGQVTVVFGQLSLPFKPAEQVQHKPLKQWFKLWQVPPWQRSQIPLLLDNEKLVAVAGYASAISTLQADCWLDWLRN
ncbi:tRNA lysidine(34) synthetase TilS [Arsukibacterium indicum]|uniref:tRNA(Ile)-lysidine synthase n=1 Tax=Arsukibacterium indicum TaxID=2848612 RepID=A0ABS6MH41_9GAMM|nr:tRNA lysidine(34) synthetase TilS [Arsukibacterium indicum]MBV2128135.1 tRNA lysidine(34) synthetase TilS [Arsukibacterium indicum]